MTLNWRDIEERAVTLSHSYADAKDEDRDTKPFWKDVFALFGIDPRVIGSFEERVKIHGRPGTGKMDYFAPKKFLIEQKSRGKDLDEAYAQAMDYFDSLKVEDKPRYVVLCDFNHLIIHDLEGKGKKRMQSFLVKDLSQNIKKLAFLASAETKEYDDDSAIDVKAVRAIGKLHKALKESFYPPEHLSHLLTRLVFCFFADDTGIFERNGLRRYLDEETKEDGSDIGAHLSTIFQVLDTKEDARQTNMVDALAALPYVNGGLFKDPIPAIFGSRAIRDTLMQCVTFDWSNVSPAIFGSMFQSVMDEKERHDLGAHYTSEKNIMKVIGPLFLDDLKEDFDKAKGEEKLRALWDKVAAITLLDPACGCGNFLVVAYRELRRLEIEIIKKLDKGGKGYISQVEGAGQAHFGLEADIKKLSRMSVERMYGIEIESFPAEVAKLSLWLMDHMMNMELGAVYGKPMKKLPLTEAPHIVEGNALRLNWEEVVPKDKLTHILGNPPFLGHHLQTPDQKTDLKNALHNLPSVGVMDFVSGWYVKAAEYVQGTSIECAFVSTNSIAQGEQVGILWGDLLSPLGVHIRFAHQTFKWSNEATGKAAVYCIIIGFGLRQFKERKLFVYKDIQSEATEFITKNINPYLVDASSILVRNRAMTLCAVPPMVYGNKPTDGGNLILTTEEKNLLIKNEPRAQKYIRRFIGAEEFLNGSERWCLWLVDADPKELRALVEISKRVENVATFRSLSKAAATRGFKYPTLFRQIAQPKSDYILVPSVSSEKRNYVPMGFMSKEVIASNLCLMIPKATLYHFGVLESEMHMTWMRAVAGRLESRYRYSKDIVYNNFPWPDAVIGELKKRVEDAAQAVLDARAEFSSAALADLYNPNTMPKKLLDAHHALDRAVDAAYGKKPSDFSSEPARLEFLFERYQRLIAAEQAKTPAKPKKNKVSAKV